ncbi:Basic 7S globulin [Triticum urartu]|uniref:Peptidase A1 domain-containing protein n=2 Tax=Triticum TaxID=4564 RepID=A0A9R0QC74_TRITD|nr:Basic 7S globulin [Triticum urartu]VAH07229.1 unnamed protein product [Triticum turgidum subsp. durum]
MARSTRLVASTATALLLLLLSACSCRAAGDSPSAVVLAVRKDGATGQYLTGFRQRTPQVPVTAVLDLGGGTLWVDCDAGRARFALPTQLAAAFRFSRKFALCLTSTSAAGAVVFGDAPYAFQPGVDLSKSLLYTPLLVNNVSTAGVSGEKDKSNEYFIGVTAIKVNGRAVPLNASLLVIDKQGGGGTKLSTVAPYTVLETSIHKAVTDAFAAETAMIPRVRAVAPFKLCYDGSKVGSTRVGPAVPTVELVLQSEAASWVVFGANSMVAVKGGALCLGVVDGGAAPRTSVVVGGHMMEDNLLEFDLQRSRLGFSSSLLFRQTTCNNFRLG